MILCVLTNMNSDIEVVPKGEMYDSLRERYWALDRNTHPLYYKAVLLVCIAVSYDGVWVAVGKWFAGIQIPPHYCHRRGTVSEVAENSWSRINVGWRKEDGEDVFRFNMSELALSYDPASISVIIVGHVVLIELTGCGKDRQSNGMIPESLHPSACGAHPSTHWVRDGTLPVCHYSSVEPIKRCVSDVHRTSTESCSHTIKSLLFALQNPAQVHTALVPLCYFVKVFLDDWLQAHLWMFQVIKYKPQLMHWEHSAMLQNVGNNTSLKLCKFHNVTLDCAVTSRKLLMLGTTHHSKRRDSTASFSLFVTALLQIELSQQLWMRCNLYSHSCPCWHWWCPTVHLASPRLIFLVSGEIKLLNGFPCHRWYPSVVIT